MEAVVEQTGTSVRSVEKALTSAWPRAMISSLSASAKVSPRCNSSPVKREINRGTNHTVDSSLVESSRRNTRHVVPYRTTFRKNGTFAGDVDSNNNKSEEHFCSTCDSHVWILSASSAWFGCTINFYALILTIHC